MFEKQLDGTYKPVGLDTFHSGSASATLTKVLTDAQRYFLFFIFYLEF
jgi:hypothetical protein